MELNPISKNYNKSRKTLGGIYLGVLTLLQVKHIRNLDLLDSGTTDHAINSRDAFINFRPLREKTCTATGKQIISYERGDIIKKFGHFDIMFINVLYIPTLVSNLYSMS